MSSFLDPAILFFVFGLCAGLFKSNLEIPAPISRFLSLYLLMSLGLKGGFALAKSGFGGDVASSLACAVLLAMVIPLLAWQLLRRFVNDFDAAAIAATYGSVSAVTFITATQMLETQQIPFGGHMAAAMALMESPAIIMAVLFANRARHAAHLASQRRPALLVHAGGGARLTAAAPAPGASVPLATQGLSIKKLLHESFTDGAQLLLLGSLLIGWLTGEHGQKVMAPFSVDLFKGMLAFFLLDMGLLAARSIGGLKGQSKLVPLFALLAPLVHASLALGCALVLHLKLGDAVLLMALAASASYIAVPAVVRHAIPEANPSMYIGMSLALTFPLNILAGLPLYLLVARQFFPQ
jgi:hypothetical protein